MAGAQVKVSALTADTTPTGDDLILTVNDPAGTPGTKRTTVTQLGTYLSSQLSLNSGWTPVTDSWAYALADAITIPSDGTTVYQKGVKIRFKQGAGYKYYTASAVAATLLTVLVNSDYTVANAAITDVAYSYAESPFGWPVYFNFVPTLTGFSADPTTTVYRYKPSSGSMRIDIRQTANGTSNATTFTMTLPATAATVTNMVWISADASVVDNSAGVTTPGAIFVSSAGTVMNIYTNQQAAGWTSSGGKRLAIGNITYEW